LLYKHFSLDDHGSSPRTSNGSARRVSSAQPPPSSLASSNELKVRQSTNRSLRTTRSLSSLPTRDASLRAIRRSPVLTSPWEQCWELDRRVTARAGIFWTCSSLPAASGSPLDPSPEEDRRPLPWRKSLDSLSRRKLSGMQDPHTMARTRPSTTRCAARAPCCHKASGARTRFHCSTGITSRKGAV
jgi:hypothetical protein